MKIPIIFGPTACGKTSLSIALAKALNGEIISADSMQIYKGLNIGTAKVKADEMEGIKHHLIDIKEVGESYDVFSFVVDATNAILEIKSRGKTPILVGGTGLYLKALATGYDFENTKHKQKNDRHLLQKIFTQDDFLVIGLNLSRTEIYERINARADEMLRCGILDEAQKLHQMHTKNAKKHAKTIKNHEFYEKNKIENANSDEARRYHQTSFQAIGYKEFFPYFDGEKSLEECAAKLKQSSRNYAKRQITWMRGWKDIAWIENNEHALKCILLLLQK